IERLRPFGFDVADPGSMYKSLRQMEQEGLLSSEWELSTRGPARRIYELTADGRDLLAAWADTLEQHRAILGQFLNRYERLDAGGLRAASVRGWPRGDD